MLGPPSAYAADHSLQTTAPEMSRTSPQPPTALHKRLVPSHELCRACMAAGLSRCCARAWGSCPSTVVAALVSLCFWSVWPHYPIVVPLATRLFFATLTLQFVVHSIWLAAKINQRRESSKSGCWQTYTHPNGEPAMEQDFHRRPAH